MRARKNLSIPPAALKVLINLSSAEPILKELAKLALIMNFLDTVMKSFIIG